MIWKQFNEVRKTLMKRGKSGNLSKVLSKANLLDKFRQKIQWL